MMTPELLRQRIKAGEPLMDLDLRGMAFSAGDYAGAILMRCDLRGVRAVGDWRDTQFSQCRLQESTWDQVCLDQCVFHDCDATAMRVARVSATGMTWSQCHAPGLDLSGSVLAQCTFTRTCLDRASFADASLRDVTFAQCAVEQIDFSRCHQAGGLVYEADLRLADLSAIQWDGVACVKVDVSGQRFRDASLQRCQLTECMLDDVDFSAALLTQTGFKGASMRQANLTGVHASRCMFAQADLSRAIAVRGRFDQSLWKEACVEHVDFRGADLTQAIFHYARSAHALFNQAVLTYTDFSYADLQHADMRAGRFERTQCHRALIAHTRWDDRSGILENDPQLFDAERWSAGRSLTPREG